LPSDPWSADSTVRGFATGAPNADLMAFARTELTRIRNGRALDIGCGAGRNAVPLAASGWQVTGIDRSMSMLAAAAERAHGDPLPGRCRVVQGTMEALPITSESFDLVIAHGIWNLARSDDEFRAAIRDAARVARPGAALFVFTFSRGTLHADAHSIPGESLVFPGITGGPNTFLTREQIIGELAAAGFAPEPALPLRELNPRTPGMLAAAGSPVIWQGAFRRG